MKKKLLSLTLIFSVVISFSQSIPNGGFESWSTTTYENPQFFETSNYDDHTGGFYGVNCTKTTDAYHGNFAVILTTTGSNANPAFAYIANGSPGQSSASYTNSSGGIPYSQKPTGIRFHYKSNILSGDSATVITIFRKSGVNIGFYKQKIATSSSVYTVYNNTFSPALPITPDTVIFAVASSNVFGNLALVGNSLQIDSVLFTGVSAQPANFNSSFENWQTVQDSKLNGWKLRGGNTQSTDFYTGTYAIELQTLPPSLSTGNSVASGEASTGNNIFNNVKGGYPFSNQIDTIVFRYKYIPADPLDNGEFYIYFKKNGIQIAQTNNSLAISPSYQQVVIPFNTGIAPDTINIMFRSSKYPVLNSYVGSDLKVDNLYLKSQKTPISFFNAPLTGCVGQAINLIDNSANMANAWGWIMPGGTPGSSTLQNPIVIYNSTGIKTISMIASNQFGSGLLVSKTITINPLPVVYATSTITACGGSNVILTANGANFYSWSSGQTTPTIAVTATISTNFTVTGATNGCTNTAIGSVIVPSGITPQICMVTTDSVGNNNEIYWDKTQYARVDSFIIYRETPTITNTLTGSYSRIGAVSKTAFSMYTDTARHIGGFVNGNPSFTSYKYKLQIKDSCGIYSALSPYHQTIFVQDQQNGNFNWNPYSIEGSTITPVSNYVLYRRNINTGQTSTVAATSSNLLTDPYYNVFYPTTIKWFVDAQGFNCNPTFKINGILANKQKTKSNNSNERTYPAVSITKNVLEDFEISIYPNPAKDIVNIEIKMLNTSSTSPIIQAEITNILGQIVQTASISNQKTSINVQYLNSGIYFLNLKQNATSFLVKKIIIN